MIKIAIKRVYEEVSPLDGYRILVDRLWPRGISKEKAQIHEWNKAMAPSTELRKWFNHEPEKWEIFCKKYVEELKSNHIATLFWEQHQNKEKITLLYATKDPKYYHPLVLREYLEDEKFK